MRGLAAQALEVELRHQAARRPVPELEGAREEADADVLVDEAELLEDLERWRLRGRGARAVIDALLRLEQRHLMPKSRAGQRSDGADRPGPHDEDFHQVRRLY